MTILKDTYSRLIALFMLSVVATFFLMRPLQSPWHPFIAGDGLGYYAYLPAKYIYHDKDLKYAWFNKAYKANYVYSTFDNPEDNLLVAYGNKRINKYYPGLSYIWWPFFMAAHATAHLLHYPADGFSQPYQWWIGFASLLYLLLGLHYLRKLLLKLGNKPYAALAVTAAIFFGTHLFSYAIFANSLSHAYSFTFNVLFLYFAVSVIKGPENRLRNFLLAALFLTLTTSIRPLNALLVLLWPFFLSKGFFYQKFPKEKWNWIHVSIVLVWLLALYHHFSITYTQTGSLFAYTYTDEHFNFLESKFFDGLFSYYMGLFVYVPIAFLAFFGIRYMPPAQRVALPLFFLGIVFLYTSWWYWLITKRALIDYYPLLAIFLAALYSAVNNKRSRNLVATLSVLSVLYYQFKDMQVRRGILDEFATYKEVFWRNFFRTDKAKLYLVPPQSIILEETQSTDFENSKGFVTSQAHSGQVVSLLSPSAYIQTYLDCNYPAIFADTTQQHKIRFSFYMYAKPAVKSVHAFIQFFDSQHKSILDVPLYLNEDDIFPGKWDYKEFGYDIVDHKTLGYEQVHSVGFTIWNVEARDSVFIDDPKAEFILSRKSFETLK